MKTKLEMAHEYAMVILSNPEYDEKMETLIKYSWIYADAMQAEAEKRKPKEPRETHKNLAEFSMYPEYDASINYPPDAWVMYKGEKRLAASIDIKKEWQPDWSQAPEWANFLVMSCKGTSYWHSSEPRTSGRGWVDGGHCDLAHLDCYCTVGDWRESLRKRPK